MIITCPDCATRYDVDDERFSPSGRSVRCSSCGESWFVPAPELIDVAPLEEKAPRRRHASEDDDVRPSPRPRMKVGIADPHEDDRRSAREANAGRKHDRDALRDERDEERLYEEDRSCKTNEARVRPAQSADYADDDADDDSLFDSPPRRKERDRAQDHRPDPRSRGRREARGEEDDQPADKGWRKGRQFIVEEEDTERRPFFARKNRNKDEMRDAREALRFADDEDRRHDDARDNRGSDDEYDNAYVVDADWEDVEAGAVEIGRGFGRKIRAERRRATALARVDDVRPFGPETLDEEFFAALRVTPRELERAIRKARRRAEAREKNRLTPWRVIGWAAWAAVVIGAGFGVFVFRDEIVKMAPKAADAYAVVGIEANPYGLSIENVRHRLAMSTGGAMIEITGNLRNKTDATVTAPLMQAEALGPRGELLARWTFTASQPEVAQGDMADFITRAPAPEGVAEVALSFAPEKSVLQSLIPGAQ